MAIAINVAMAHVAAVTPTAPYNEDCVLRSE